MYEIKIIDWFCGAHNLLHYKGKCETLHGHNWRVEVSVFSDSLNRQGMVMDFKELKKMLRGILSRLDHRYLNEVSYFKKNNPTSENIARFIHKKLSRHTKGKVKVSVWETQSSCASFYSES